MREKLLSRYGKWRIMAQACPITKLDEDSRNYQQRVIASGRYLLKLHQMPKYRNAFPKDQDDSNDLSQEQRDVGYQGGLSGSQIASFSRGNWLLSWQVGRLFALENTANVPPFEDRSSLLT